MDCNNTQARITEPTEEMPPEYGRATPEEIRNFDSARLRLRRRADVEVVEFVTSRQAISIDRILAALDSEFIPNDLDRDALQNDLQRGIWHYDDAEEARPRSGKGQFAALRKTEKLARRLVAVLESEDVRQHLGRLDCKYAIGALDDVMRGCRSPIDDLEDEEFSAKFGAVRAGVRPRTERYNGWGSFEWLVGYYSPRTYKKHFRRKPPTTPNGLYARFAERVLMEFRITNRGEPYKRSSIAKALRDVSSGRARQKPRT
jgi:hypothetical protein